MHTARNSVYEQKTSQNGTCGHDSMNSQTVTLGLDVAFEDTLPGHAFEPWIEEALAAGASSEPGVDDGSWSWERRDDKGVLLPAHVVGFANALPNLFRGGPVTLSVVELARVANVYSPLGRPHGDGAGLYREDASAWLEAAVTAQVASRLIARERRGDYPWLRFLKTVSHVGTDLVDVGNSPLANHGLVRSLVGEHEPSRRRQVAIEWMLEELHRLHPRPRLLARGVTRANQSAGSACLVVQTTFYGFLHMWLLDSLATDRLMRACRYCDIVFLPSRRDRKYCSDRCREAGWRRRSAS